MWEKWSTSSSSKWVRGLLVVVLWLLAFLGSSGVQPFLDARISVNGYIWRFVEYGFLLAGLLLLLSPVEWICRRIAWRWREYPGRSIEVRYVKPAETNWLFDFCRTFYSRDDHVINRESLKDFLDANPNTAKVFLRNGEPVGLYILLSLNKRAVRKILDGTIQSAQELNSSHAVRGWRWATGIYVTNVSARGLMNRGIVMQELKKDIATYTGQYRSIMYVFARLANSDGSRIIRKNGFSKTKHNLPDSQIWKFEVTPSLPKGIDD